jgi:hypothetical protein
MTSPNRIKFDTLESDRMIQQIIIVEKIACLWQFQYFPTRCNLIGRWLMAADSTWQRVLFENNWNDKL